MVIPDSVITPAWTPASLPNLVAWWDASNAASITASGSPAKVSQWNDLSGNGNHFTQATGGQQPETGTVTLNGLNVIKFTAGSNTQMKVASKTPFDFLHKTVSTVIIVMQRYATPDNWLAFSTTDDGSAGRGPGFGLGSYVSFNVASVTLSGSVPQVSDDGGTFQTQGVWNQYIIMSDPTNGTAANRLTVYNNNDAGTANNTATGTVNSATSYQLLTVGGGQLAGNRAWSGYHAEIIVMSSLITGTDRANWQTYQTAKWGI